MLSAMMRTITALSILLLAGYTAAGASGETLATPVEQQTLRGYLENSADLPPLPELTAGPVSALLESPHGREILKWVQGAGREIPETTQALYDRYKEAGERFPYETPYFDKRELVTQHALANWLGVDGADLSHLCALLESVLAEPTWVLPAHVRPFPWNVDLFSAETACDLAHLLFILEDRLPPALAGRMRAEIRARVMDPYLEHAHDYWWGSGRNNWTGVCAGAIGETFLLLEPDAERQAQAVNLVLDQMDRFFQHAFEEDGACLEGIDYWNYGLLHCVAFGEMLRVRTNGAVDLLAHPKLKAIATYPAAAALGRHVFASFADSYEQSTIVPFIAARLAQRTGVESLLLQAGGMTEWRLMTVLRNLSWWQDLPAEEPEIEDTFLPTAGIVKFVWSAGGQRAVLAAKGGHNGEPHNHNDVGSFVLRFGDTTCLCDPGAGLYSRDYFSPKRYDNVFANSYGHSVPRLGGALQSTGEQFRGTVDVPAPKQAHIDLTGAYQVEGLTKAERVFSVQEDGMLAMDTRYTFDGPGQDVEEVFMTWLEVEIDGPTARVRSKDGVLEIRAAAGAFATESLEDACKANHKSGVLTRLTLLKPAAAEIQNHYTFTFFPAE
jgi:hypothetical protein